jgi:hypothetical protein
LGAVPGLVLVLLLAEPLRLNRDSRVIGTLLYLVPSVAALFGFNQTWHTLPRVGCEKKLQPQTVTLSFPHTRERQTKGLICAGTTDQNMSTTQCSMMLYTEVQVP